MMKLENSKNIVIEIVDPLNHNENNEPTMCVSLSVYSACS